MHAQRQFDFLVEEGKAGPVEVGMPVDDVIHSFGKDAVRLVDLQKEGRFTPAVEIVMPGASVANAIVADIDWGPCGAIAIRGITVRDPRFRTADGLGVGSTLAQLRAIRAIRVSQEEGGTWAVFDDRKMSFGLQMTSADSGHVTHLWLWLDARVVRERRCPA